MSSEPRNPFQGGGGPIAKFEKDGDSVGGTIVKVEYRDATDIDGNVRTFDDGSPRPCVVVHLDTGGEENVRDFVQGRSVTAFREAVWAEEGDNQEPKPGAKYRRTMTGTKPPSKKGYSAEKLFEVQYRAGEDSTDTDDRDLA